MIELTRLNGNRIDVNCDLIRYVEASPDTVLTLVTGEKLLVREAAPRVADLIFHYRVNLLRTAWPEAAAALAARAAYDNSRAESEASHDAP